MLCKKFSKVIVIDIDKKSTEEAISKLDSSIKNKIEVQQFDLSGLLPLVSAVEKTIKEASDPQEFSKQVAEWDAVLKTGVVAYEAVISQSNEDFTKQVQVLKDNEKRENAKITYRNIRKGVEDLVRFLHPLF